MRAIQFPWLGVGTIVMAAALFPLPSHADAPLTEEQAYKLGTEAYYFGYPLVLMDVTHAVLTAVPRAGETGAPANQFLHRNRFADAKSHVVVSPNVDTLYSGAMLDLAREPMVLSLPAADKRYHVVQVMDAWTDVIASLGTRTAANPKQPFVVVGPAWKGTLPDGMTAIRSPTNHVWVLGRFAARGPAEFKEVHALQAGLELKPLSGWGKPYTPGDVPFDLRIERKVPPPEQIAQMDAATFFARLCAGLTANPPHRADAAFVARLSAIGIVPGKPFDASALAVAPRQGLDRAVRDGHAKVASVLRDPARLGANGWVTVTNGGRFGTDYRLRAGVARVMLAVNLPEDALYPITWWDKEGKPLTGAQRYAIHFGKDRLPPAKAFWSLTLYSPQQYLVDNPLGRHAVRSGDSLQFNADGSFDLYVQAQSPGKEREANWLPAPPESFGLMLRLYWPKDEALNGTWAAPAVERVP
ncbi:hypothetical protein AYO44_13185 [Planctomycetaceae bacterium SCGC AG-212-F19]|nr:hypothetical protein AYO44_13185 [Planctomycetaceae bacterium SCGC AG-212-F19]